ncbi:thiamine-binding protein [Macrococcus equipercicus]|uniref:Thiamine-binding protein n=1 Tax=Macrococcus equipercicus TaxID=69967 RepID=A0A9Q9BS58_9STAP|nr:MTH1187 family thiamine-binding protein [Macrococcus equipercicus]KAA1040357.1 thiamine-binding protein [Macrococcus equipercicus]UTH14716.1 thiamine-binding protein [Macrococcus equipercicus]
MADTLMSIQIIPKTPGGEDVIPYVDAAIAVIDASGLPYFVSPLETTIEGTMAELLPLIGQMNRRMMELDCTSVISQVKFYHAADASMAELVKNYR